MIRRYSSFLRRRVQLISGIIFAALLVVWTASLWLPFIADWLIAHNIIGLLLIGLVVQVIALLDDVGREPVMQAAVGHDQYQDLNELRDYVREHRNCHADLIEYSSFMVNPLIEDLVRHQATIRLLIANPSSAANKWQERRIKNVISTMRDVTIKDYAHATVRCYNVPASVRGRQIDQYLNIGWYIYGHDFYGVTGTNTMITLKTETTEGRFLKEVFDEAFDALWHHPETRQLDFSLPGCGLGPERIE